jgi:hypothetical protein
MGEVTTKLDTIKELIGTMSDRDAKWAIVTLALALRTALVGEGIPLQAANERIIAGMDCLDMVEPLLGSIQ